LHKQLTDCNYVKYLISYFSSFLSLWTQYGVFCLVKEIYLHMLGDVFICKGYKKWFRNIIKWNAVLKKLRAVDLDLISGFIDNLNGSFISGLIS